MATAGGSRSCRRSGRGPGLWGGAPPAGAAEGSEMPPLFSTRPVVIRAVISTAAVTNPNTFGLGLRPIRHRRAMQALFEDPHHPGSAPCPHQGSPSDLVVALLDRHAQLKPGRDVRGGS